MRKLTVFLLSIGLLSISNFAFAEEYDPAVCTNTLAASGFNACSQESCDAQRENPQMHQFCSGQNNPYAPIQAMVCKNSQTGEERSGTSQDLIKECMGLAQQDPHWEMKPCYCCCA